jgi:hypothetical protein
MVSLHSVQLFWEEMAGTTRFELATSAVTEHLDLEFQALAGTRGMQKHSKQGTGTLNVPALFPDSSVGIPKPTSGRIGADVLAQLQQSSKD